VRIRNGIDLRISAGAKGGAAGPGGRFGIGVNTLLKKAHLIDQFRISKFEFRNFSDARLASETF
jgi:hypothetical protein